MLISKVTDETEAARGEESEGTAPGAHDFQNASELFDIMIKNQRFDENVDDSFTTQDLVLLYKNLDLGTRLMSDAKDVRRRKPNQRVETVIYDEPESDSDNSENYSKDDIQHMYNMNQERINLLDNGSFDNLLCHKLGGLQIQSSEIISESDKQFLFRDQFIKEQLQSLNVMASGCEIQSMLPTSLLDYVCCKKIKDNYNFYMDNIIKYVQQTIDQLKRISNGDYLTDCAKEKWKKANKINVSQKSTKVLATSTSIRPAVECNGTVTWHDIVHSEIDVRSLSKVLEKKIVLEIPKLICGSYKLFSKRYAESLIITFKKEKQTKGVEEYESRLDVLLKLRRLRTGQVTSNIDSITILKASPAGHDLCNSKNLPIAQQPFKRSDPVFEDDSKHNQVLTVIRKKFEETAEPESDTKAVIDEIVTEMFGRHVSKEMLKDNLSTQMLHDNVTTESLGVDVSTEVSRRNVSLHNKNNFSNIETNDFATCERDIVTSLEVEPSSHCSYESSVPYDFRDILVGKTEIFQVYNEANYNLVSPDELRATMQRLSIQKAVPEESSQEASIPVTIKKRSPVRVRINSPYENKSYILEEKKRNKLLEIRERRVKKKVALGENAKVCKHRYCKTGVVAQPSVTKLSISNKSFYDSIYGNMENGKQRTQPHPKSQGRYSPSIEVAIKQIQDDKQKSPTRMPENNPKKYINRSYYLDDTETEVMYMSKIQEDIKNATIFSPSTSTVSNDFKKNMTLLSELTGVDLRTEDSLDENQSPYDDNNKNAGCSNKISLEDLKKTLNGVNMCNDIENNYKGAPVSIECRKSIDKLYNLIRKLENSSKTQINKPRNFQYVRNLETSYVKTTSTVPASDSGTSLKHYLTSSNPSSFSFDKTNLETQRLKCKKEHTSIVPTVPKVVISSKFEKLELKRTRKKVSPKRSVTKVAPENPLKGISQLLLEVDNVQKIRQKTISEPKPVKKPDVQCNDGKPVVIRHTLVKRRSRFDQYNMKDANPEKKSMISKDKRTKPLTPTEITKIPQLQIAVDDKTKKKMTDIIDEAKEARGEAVRGPSKLNSRIMTLAQPKRTYVQAHSEEYQTKYGRNLMADRLQRLAGLLPPPPPPSPPELILRNFPSPKNRMRREATSNVSVKQPTPPVQLQPIEKSRRTRRSASNSPQTLSAPQITTPLKAPDQPENLKKMVAVESYVRSHYGRFRHNEPTLLRDEVMQKSRIPLLPNDINIINSSADELGKELHHIIDSMVTNSPVPNHASNLTEMNFKINPTIVLKKTNSFTDDDLDSKRTDSDFDIGVLDDKSLKTAVQSQGNGDKRDDSFDNDTFDNPQDELQTSHSTSELEKLENALYTQLSGAFQKRLRLKNLTLTPKPSLNHVFLLQAGDTKSLIVKSNVPNVTDFKSVSRLSPHMGWDFAHIPVQIATVGYAFPLPEHESGPNPEITPIRRFETSLPDITGYKSDKISQCFKGVHQEMNLEQPAQVDVQDILIKAFGSKPTFTVSELMSGAECHEDNIKVDKFTITDCSHKQSISTIKSISSTEVSTSAQDNVEYTTSLDILVGLLNEIQKITRPNPPEDLECRNPKTMLRDAVSEVNDHREISMMSSLDNFDSNTGIYSYYISNSLSDSKPKPTSLVDKEVSVNILVQKELKNTFTEVPSVFPVLLSQGTSARNSLVKVITKPSTQSMISLDDYRSMCSKVLCPPHSSNTIELSKVDRVEKKVIEIKKVDLHAKNYKKVLQHTKYMGNTPIAKSVVRTKNYLITTADLDPTIKIKRDILVTVYSILVFTVFAALSFPDMALFGA